MIIITIYISKLLNIILNITIKQSAASQLRQQSLRAYWGHVISSWRLGVYYETWAHVLSPNMDVRYRIKGLISRDFDLNLCRCLKNALISMLKLGKFPSRGYKMFFCCGVMVRLLSLIVSVSLLIPVVFVHTVQQCFCLLSKRNILWNVSCLLKEAVSRDFRPLFFSLIETIWVPDDKKMPTNLVTLPL